jgi:acetamidase/formamidase
MRHRRQTLPLAALALILLTPGLHAEIHRFVPSAYHATYAAHPPALRIKSGDRVITTTLDDQGAGADGKMMAAGSHPQTGPFFIEGAEPGDLIVITIERLAPNRDTGYSTSVMVTDSIDSGSVGTRPDATRFPWVIDAARGVVRLDLHAISTSTDWASRFRSTAFEMPLRPTLGSIGVAPEGGVSTPASMPGPFGGNMVSAALTEGTRVMLPVFTPGALLFLGHGHARQGDGGVTGGGVEVSLDVEFSVEVVKKREWPHSSVVRPSTVVGEFPQGWPRLESEDSLMTVGSAPALLQALQHATTELHHWLDDDFGLSEKAVTIFMGQAVEYEIASLGPAFTVVARVRKAYLPPPVVAP